MKAEQRCKGKHGKVREGYQAAGQELANEGEIP
jgi:hypothetical protein